MALETPALRHQGLSELSARYVKTDETPWEPMAGAPGVQMKVLVQDTESGLFTALFQIEPGGVGPDH